MEKLASLDFTTPNNACLSLRTLAEWVRVGEVKVDEAIAVRATGCARLVVSERDHPGRG